MVVPEVAAQLKELRKRGVDTVVLCGIETHVCILATCQDLRAEGLNVSDNSDEQYLISLVEEESFVFCTQVVVLYRVAHLLWERFMLTSNSKFRHKPGSQDRLTANHNFNFGVNIFLSQSRWATLYKHFQPPNVSCLP